MDCRDSAARDFLLWAYFSVFLQFPVMQPKVLVAREGYP
jgi:hypothetical protein